MDDPIIGRTYEFVRVEPDGSLSVAQCTRYDDGSAFVDDAQGATIWEESDEAWKMALADLRRRGYRPKDS